MTSNTNTSTKRVMRLKVETFTTEPNVWGVNELARATGIAPITISRLMRRLEAPSREAMEKFASTFPDMDPADLVEFVSVDLSAAPAASTIDRTMAAHATAADIAQSFTLTSTETHGKPKKDKKRAKKLAHAQGTA